MSLDPQLVADLERQLEGPVLQPGHPAYESARRIHNGLVDRRPALIARCRNAEDVSAALRVARGAGLEVCVRGGGHNVAGRAVVDGALMIDLAEMKDVDVDPDAMTARAEAGLNWGELNAVTAEHGLAVTGGAISTTGIAGLTLGGGLGWLMAKHGLAADNLVAAEVVTADGEVREISEAADPDLFWAIRGGGGNFGVVTSFTYRLHPISTVTGGLIAHPVDAAPGLLRFYRDAVEDCSDDLTVFAVLAHAPDGSGHPIVALAVFHTGDPKEAERDLEPFLTWGEPIVTQVGPIPYPVMNTLLDAGYPPGALNYWLSSFTAGLTDELIDALADRFTSAPSPMTAILLEHFHGAVTRVPVEATAVPHRVPGWNLAILSVWLDSAESEANIGWTRETHAALAPHLVARRWLNYLSDDDGEDAIRDAYGPNYARLARIKGRVDPDNVFHHNHNIPPA